MENHRIPDSAITASSERIYYLRASQGRLRMRSFFPWLPAGWSAAVSNRKQWLEINLTVKTKVTKIATQGLSSRWSPDQWVTSYQVSYKDGVGRHWTFYRQRGQVKVFLHLITNSFSWQSIRSFRTLKGDELKFFFFFSNWKSIKLNRPP